MFPNVALNSARKLSKFASIGEFFFSRGKNQDKAAPQSKLSMNPT